MPISLTTALAFLISVALILVLRRFAEPLGLIDHPAGRKAHTAPVPAVGGLAMFVAFAPVALMALPGTHGLALAVALGVLVLVGVLDDRFQLRPRFRFMAELAAALLLVLSGQSVVYLGNLLGLGPLHTGFTGALFSMVCYVGLTNATNMVDGIDGLAGSLALVAILFFTGIAVVTGNHPVALVGAAAIGALAGFLFFNLRIGSRARAAVFMGDAGSMFVGCLLAWFAITLAGREPSPLTPIGAVWIVAIPLLDMGSVMLHRMRTGRSPFDGDRRHLHYLLVDSGVSVPRAVAILTAAALLCGVIGTGFPLLGIPEWAMFAAFIATLFATYRVVSRSVVPPLHVEGIRTTSPRAPDASDA
jgi:UDP-GlcNAc:undecaprenyl-phosphate GlcNAc-1-phosphate transferase